MINVWNELVIVWDELINVRDNMMSKDKEKNFSLSAASLTEVGYRGELGIDRPGLKIEIQ